MMDFRISEQQRELMNIAQSITAMHCDLDSEIERDKSGEFPEELYEALAGAVYTECHCRGSRWLHLRGLRALDH